MRAEQAVQSTRRLLDASPFLITGTAAVAFCLPATWLTLLESVDDEWVVIAAAIAMVGFLAWVFTAMRLTNRVRSAAGINVVDRADACVDVPFLVVVAGTFFLYQRWRDWARSLRGTADIDQTLGPDLPPSVGYNV
jgi:hypothetical protein